VRTFAGMMALIAAISFYSCSKKQDTEAARPAAESPGAAQPAGGPHAIVHLKNGSNIPGTIVASSQTDMIVAGDDGIEHKIPLAQVKSVEYGEKAATPAARTQAPAPRRTVREAAAPPQTQAARQVAEQAAQPPVQGAAAKRTYELPPGSEISVRMNEAIDSGTAVEGQTFEAQVTRDATDASGAVVIPRGSAARVVIKSASKGGRFRGASDLVLDVQSIVINGRTYAIETAEVTQQGKSGVGANKRTAEYAGGGAALGAIIGAIAGGGKGAAIGAGAGAGAGALTQVLTKGGAIKVPAESVLTFRLDKPLRVTAPE
jgi:hypothetical protein